MKTGQKIITRIAPSPTGYLHVGTARTALFNFLFSRNKGGSFIVRIEDTDKKRSEKKYEDDILEKLLWLGIEYDAIYRQSERALIYKSSIEKLLNEDKAYISKEQSKDDRDVEVEIVRLRNPNADITFNDLVRGKITFNTKELGDFVIARSIDEPLYHLAVVVDDADMNITHVIRGEDHISNTPRQILIGQALGVPRPEYAHIPLILAPDRSKLSKRSKTTMGIDEYQKMGYLPQAVVNYLALLGWNPGTERELFTLNELADLFSIDKIQKGGAIFDREKLNWFNGEHLKKLSKEELAVEIKKRMPDKLKKGRGGKQKYLEEIAPLLVERIHRWDELEAAFKSGRLDYYFDDPLYETSDILPKKGGDLQATLIHLKKTIDLLSVIPENQFTKDVIKGALWDYADERGRGEVLWPVRFALSGSKYSPDPFSLSEVFGKEETLSRIKKAIAKLNEAQKD